jgi:acyl-CoA hydrolase
VVIVEATAIREDGGIIPGASVGASPELIQMAEKVNNGMLHSVSRETPNSLASARTKEIASMIVPQNSH